MNMNNKVNKKYLPFLFMFRLGNNFCHIEFLVDQTTQSGIHHA